jgi:hypothetical protein
MAQGLTEAVMRRPPRGNGTGVAGQAYTLTLVATTPSVETNVLAVVERPTTGGCWVTFKASADSTIRFGLATQVGANATVNDFLISAGQDEEFWIAFPDDGAFSARSTAGGTLYWFRSSR